MKNLRKFTIGVMLILFLASCAAHNPNISMVYEALTRAEGEKELGSPIKSRLLENGDRVDKYVFTFEKQFNSDLWEDMANARRSERDLRVKIGIYWSLPIWYPFYYHAKTTSEKNQIEIIYDKNDNVIGYTKVKFYIDEERLKEMQESYQKFVIENHGIKTSEDTGAKYGFAP